MFLFIYKSMPFFGVIMPFFGVRTDFIFGS